MFNNVNNRVVSRNAFILLALTICLIVLAACGPAAATGGDAPTGTPDRQIVRVFCAGSLMIPVEALEQAFETANPDGDVQNECHGSIQVIRHVTELHEPIDVVMTADHALIPLLMYSTIDEDTGQPYSRWYIRFAGNSLGLAYTANSRYAGEINAENWYEVLSRPDVKIGLPDPRFDAAGYRMFMVTTLAQKYYGAAGLFDTLLKGDFTYPVTHFAENGLTEITVPEVLETTAGANTVLRGSSIQLLALLETGDIDYAFEYASVIAQHDLMSITLPDEINLGDPAYAEQYGAVQVKLDFQRFASVQPVFRGEPIGYGITIPANAPHPDAAERYVDFLLSQAGREVMESVSHPLLDPVICDQIDHMPAGLQKYCGGAQ